MRIHNIEQRTYEWHLIKHGVIGGTLAKGLFVKSDTLLIDLLSQKLEEFDYEESYISFDMQRGIDLEPQAREELSREIFVQFNEVGFLQHDTIDILGISPDGISEDLTIQCEIKCPAAKKHTSTILADEIPSDNIHQVLHAFVVNEKLESLFFCSYRPENKIKPLWYKEIKQDSLIDLGTKSKPQVKSVSEWRDIALNEAKQLQEDLDAAMEKLKNLYQ